jgi:GNAT superfamily N-acetyltransferase
MKSIINCTHSDLNNILFLYQCARDLQTEKQMVVWPVFERAFVEAEIEEQRQWKILVDDRIACNWAITFEDKQIWQERDKGDSIYIHRIATHPDFRGRRYIDDIVAWARDYAAHLGKEYIRLDTLGENKKLISHYTSAGFDFLGIERLKDTTGLPGHYQREANCCRFEIRL